MAKNENKGEKETRLDEALGESISADDARVYELGFHLDPELPTEEVKRAYHEVRERLAASGTIVAEGEPLQIPLAYTISRTETAGRRDFDSAHFAWIAYEISAKGHDEVLTAMRSDTRIIRFIDLMTDREAARHGEALRELAAKIGEPVPEGIETAASAELDAALESATI